MSKYDNASLVQIPSGYKAGTLYSVLPANGDGDFDFTRASIATRVNSQGLIETVASGVPRLDYPLLNGVVQSCPALLLEPARTNLALYSEDFSNAAWTSNLTVITNATTAPDGSINADKVYATTGTGKRLYRTVGITSATAYTFSFFAKAGGKNFTFVPDIDNSVNNVWFDLSNGTFSSPVEGTAQMINYGNGWYRCICTTTSSTTSGYSYIGLSDASGSINFTENGTDGVYIWGAMLEAGSYATSYIPTSGTTVARAAEVCNGAGTSAEFNDSEGVLFAEIAGLVDDASFRFITIVNGTQADNQVKIGYDTVASQLRIACRGAVGGTYVKQIAVDDVLLNNKVALKYKANDFATWINGFEYGVQLSGTDMPSGMNNLRFEDGDGANDFYGKTKQLIAFDAALTDEQLEDLTSWDSFEELAASQFYTLY